MVSDISVTEHRHRCLDNLGCRKWKSTNLVVARDVFKELRAKHHRELAKVHLGNENAVILCKNFSQILREWIDVAKMSLRNT